MRTVLITGCSQGGLGDALAQAFHASSSAVRVIATARNLSKVAHLQSLGIETVQLDVLSLQSIEHCVTEVSKMTGGQLDILLNNSGAGYSMPLADASIEKGRELFELNVWAVLRVTQAFLPLLMKSAHGGMIVNNTSIGSVVSTPLLGVYNASKAAVASMTAALRLELQPFGIKVIDMKTGAVKSQFFQNQKLSSSNNNTASVGTKLPANTIYAPARADIERILDGAGIEPTMVESDVWAKAVVRDLLGTSPAPVIWRGGSATMVRLSAFLPQWVLDRLLKQIGGIDIVEKRLKEQKQKSL